MHQILGPILLCTFLVCYVQGVASSKWTWNDQANKTGCTTSRQPKFMGKKKLIKIGSDLNNTKFISFVFSIDWPSHKSCARRCSSIREFRKPKDNMEKCFCDPWCDLVFKDCCADYDEQCNASLMKENTSKDELDELWSCNKIDVNRFSIWVIAKCNPAWKHDDIAKQCTRPDKRIISTQIPVTDDNNVTFLNRYCAICNGINAYEPWDFKVKCNAIPPRHYTETESWQFADDFCPLKFLDREFSTRGIRYCYDVVDKCKDDSMESKYKRNCEQCPTGLVTERKSCTMQDNIKNYRNLDCFLCNHQPRASQTNGPCLPRIKVSKIDIPRPYSAIFTSSTTNSFTSYTRCPTTQIYNSRSGKCAKLSNAHTTTKIGHELLQRFAVVLKYEDAEHLEHKQDIERRFRDVFEKLLKISLIEFNFEHSDLHVHKQNESSFVVTFQLLGLQQQPENRDAIRLDYSKIQRLIFHASFREDKNHGLCEYSLTEQVTREMFCAENTSFVMANASTLFPNGTLQVHLNQTHYNQGEFLKYNESHIAVCKRFKPSNCSFFNVIQNASDFILFPNRSIYSHVTQSLFDYGQYSIIDSKLWVCLTKEQVLKANRIERLQPSSPSVHTTILSYFTVVSLSISVLSSALVTVVYSMNKSLRNVPGKNLMLLCGTLALAQTLWLTEANISPASRLCIVATIAGHFAFLSSFSTSGSIAIHSFLTFRRLAKGKLYDTSNTREFLPCCAYSLGLPAFWVSVCWILDRYEVISLRNETSKTCWLENSEGLKMAFLYPAALQLFVNITLLILTLQHIKKCTKASQKLQKRNGTMNTRHVGIYLRMSTIMGLSWLFGVFVVMFPNVVVFEYLFVVGNGFQGLYIALAFLLTKNVKKIMITRFTTSSTQSANQSYTRSEKTKT